jgi:hypothetical protein
MPKTNKIVHTATKAKLREVLLAGHFPEVEYAEHDYGHSYSLMEYAQVNARLAHLVDWEIKDRHVDPAGIFSKKRSQDFVDRVNEIMFSITPDRLKAHNQRFGTMFD